MRRLFGLGPSERTHHQRGRSDGHYADPGQGKRYRSTSRSNRVEYRDARTGREVDRRGRPIYTV